jgi:hypothetical protein
MSESFRYLNRLLLCLAKCLAKSLAFWLMPCYGRAMRTLTIDSMTLANVLKKSMAEHHLSQSDVAVLCGVSVSQVGRWIAAKATPNSSPYRALEARLPGFRNEMERVSLPGHPYQIASSV